MVNWHVRIRNRTFWMAAIPAFLVLLQAICQACGVAFDYTEISGKLISIVEAAFVFLAILGIVADPTTQGLADSERALGYEYPAGGGLSRDDDDAKGA